MSTFQTLYKKLNKEQKKAVDTIDGPVMIIAGPGTGKTMTLTMRIANILQKTDTDPHGILALTFTDSGAKEMRKRLIEIIGPTAYYVNIHTFHSFANSLINEHGEIFQFDEETEPLSDLERVEIFKDLIDKTDLNILRPANTPYFYIHSISRKIQELKREHINPQNLKVLVKEEKERLPDKNSMINPRTQKPYTKFTKRKRDIEKQEELQMLYKKYQKELKKRKRYDFEDMINLVVETLEENEDFKLSLQEKFLYLLVDEYQDTNSAQNEIIKLLTDSWENPNVFVVGDDEQAIFRFQGASLENVIYFKRLFKKSEIITLTSNYRSSQKILDASRELISKNLQKLKNIDKKLKSNTAGKKAPISVYAFSNNTIEAQFIANKVSELIKDSTDADNIAVLVRNNADMDYIKETLARNNVRFETSSKENILEDGDVKRLLKILETINNISKKPDDDIDLFTLLNYEFLHFNKLDVLKLSRFASSEKVNLLDAIVDKDIFDKVKLKSPKKFVSFVNKLSKWNTLDKNTTFLNFFETVIKESGFLDWILEDKNEVSRMKTINALFEEVKLLNRTNHNLNLEDFLANINLMRENNIKITGPEFESDTDAVKLITAHKAKGSEFEYVFIAKCIDRTWGNNITRNMIPLPDGIVTTSKDMKKEKNEDERRLFYVALTRAKKKIYITHSDVYQQTGNSKNAVPSMFINEIGTKYISKVDTSKFERTIQPRGTKQLKLASNKEDSSEKDFLKKIIDDIKLNVTGLNTYLQCHYKFKLNNVLKTPRAKSPSLAFGTAVHKALEEFFKKYKKENKVPNKKFLVDKFQKSLANELLTQEEISRLKKKGEKVLNNYYNRNKDHFTQPLYIEYNFGHRNIRLAKIPLSGKIDKVVWDDKDKRTVKIVDYKTGSPKSKGEIGGKTKYSDGELKRQLLFYKLLTQLDRNFNKKATKGEFQFLEDKGRKKAKKETFNYSQDEIEELKVLINETMRNIKNLNFEKTDEYRHCQRCPYNDHCWPDGIPKE